ncbi:MAG: hypothetical protein ACXVCO_00245 [Ktedonobacterales bacterium]
MADFVAGSLADCIAGMVAVFAAIFDVWVAMVGRVREYWGFGGFGCRGDGGTIVGIVADFLAGGVAAIVAGSVANFADSRMLSLVALLIWVKVRTGRITELLADFLAGIVAGCAVGGWAFKGEGF